MASDQRNDAFTFLTEHPEEEWCEKISDDIFWMLTFAAKYGDEFAQEIMDSPGKLAEKHARGFEKRCKER